MGRGPVPVDAHHEGRDPLGRLGRRVAHVEQLPIGVVVQVDEAGGHDLARGRR
jgi:hypothetical protein